MTRLHPLSIPYRAGRTVARLAWLLVLAGVGSASVGFDPLPVVLAVLAAFALALGYQLLYYRRFEYALDETTFDIRSGVLSRREREIPYRRVQNVDVGRTALQRVLGIAAVDVETAGGGDTEASLRYVSDAEARRLQDELGRRKDGSGADRDRSREREQSSLFAIAPRELGLLGLVSLDLRYVSVLFVGLSLAAPSVAARLEPRMGNTLLVAAPLLLAGVYVAAAFVSGVVSITNYYGFRLDRLDDELRYERGLVQRFSGTVPLEKVQTLVVEANVLARALGYARLVVETAGYAPGDDERAVAVPIAERERVLGLARSIEPFADLEFERPPPRARTRYAVRYALALAALALVGYGADRLTGFALAWYLPLAALPLAPVAAHVKWRHRGYTLLEDHVVTRNGFWVERVQVVPYYRVQNVVTSATVFQRRRRLATLTVDTAGSRSVGRGQPRAVDLDREVAADLREAVADRLQAALADRRRQRAPHLDRDDSDAVPDASPG